MKMKWNTILLSMLLGISLNSQASSVVVYNEANLSIGQYWKVEIFNVNKDLLGKFGGNWDTLRFGMKFPTTDFYNIGTVIYCMGEKDKCLDANNFKTCFIQDNGLPNDGDTNMDVHLLPDESCFGVRTIR